ncbi:helix-turn-helix domain-containing protein [Pedococcus dokdonensis]|uniref:helix-turn-helix domain-containing protein n=1 Tax=Pedococcus dokdonensis TaxID=443156 RepID=UPI0018D42C0A|nr:helix-turn-helix domain-containing protein [Pedococcus dokdonensis]
MTPAEAAARLGCSVETVRRRIREGVLPTYPLDRRTRLVRVSDLDLPDLSGGRR